MTREEAIVILKKHHMWTGDPQELIEVRKENKALAMAISALSENKGECISIDDVMSVFDDFMCGEVDEEGRATFLEMLKDKAESGGDI